MSRANRRPSPAGENPSRSSEFNLKLSELDLKRQELELKAAEHDIKKREFNRSRWTNPLVVALFVAAAAALTNTWQSYYSNSRQAQAEQRRWEISQLDERNRWIGIQLAELLKQITRTIFAIEDAVLKFERLQGAIPASVDEFSFWRNKEVLEATEKMQEIRTVLLTRYPEIGMQVDSVFEDFRAFAQRTAEEIILLSPPTKPELVTLLFEPNIRRTIGTHWRRQLALCQGYLGIRLAVAAQSGPQSPVPLVPPSSQPAKCLGQSIHEYNYSLMPVRKKLERLSETHSSQQLQTTGELAGLLSTVDKRDLFSCTAKYARCEAAALRAADDFKCRASLLSSSSCTVERDVQLESPGREICAAELMASADSTKSSAALRYRGSLQTPSSTDNQPNGQLQSVRLLFDLDEYQLVPGNVKLVVGVRFYTVPTSLPAKQRKALGCTESLVFAGTDASMLMRW